MCSLYKVIKGISASNEIYDLVRKVPQKKGYYIVRKAMPDRTRQV